VIEKLPAAMTPTDRSRASASISSKSGPLRPDDPTTTDTPRRRAVITWARTAEADV
jgi:hypothetical protein